jgi:hypothetical protein
MTNESVFLTADSIKWASSQLQLVPDNQLLLIFILVLAAEPDIQRTNASRNPFLIELEKYIGGPLKGGGNATYNLFTGTWRAEDYLQSTVFGRLLNGGHGWTNPASGYLIRTPERQWPANFKFSSECLNRLKKRSSPPYLKAGSRLPLSAVAIWYYKFEELESSQVNDIESLRRKYLAKLEQSNSLTLNFFEEEDNLFWGNLLSQTPLTDDEKTDLFPQSPFMAEPRIKISVFEDDLKVIKQMKQPNEDIADVIRRMIMEKK